MNRGIVRVRFAFTAARSRALVFPSRLKSNRPDSVDGRVRFALMAATSSAFTLNSVGSLPVSPARLPK